MSKPIRYIAIDDNTVDSLLLEHYATAYPFLQGVGSFDNPAAGMKAIETQQPDLVFLDVEMPGASGIEVLRFLQEKIPLAVFITSHAEFAVEGFELSAFDYIVKPLTPERFAKTAARLKDYWEMKEQARSYKLLFENDSIIFTEGYSKIKLALHDIIYLEAMQDYTKIVTPTRNYLTLTTLTAMLEKLPANLFARIHRSYAVAVSKIKALKSNELVCMDTVLPIGKTYRSAIAQLKW